MLDSGTLPALASEEESAPAPPVSAQGSETETPAPPAGKNGHLTIIK
jgi:hypothetical protein